MKDENDKHTTDLLEANGLKGADFSVGREGGFADLDQPMKAAPKVAGSADLKLPADAKPVWLGNGFMHLVPVSFVAKDWRVSSRRIRALLSEGRLQGQQQDNGYWEVVYPYRFTFGTRGPNLRRGQRVEKSPKKVELRVV